jgi:hypothetical protein
MAIANATKGISNFGHQIWNLLEKSVGMMYRSSTFDEGQTSQVLQSEFQILVIKFRISLKIWSE